MMIGEQTSKKKDNELGDNAPENNQANEADEDVIILDEYITINIDLMDVKDEKDISVKKLSINEEKAKDTHKDNLVEKGKSISNN